MESNVETQETNSKQNKQNEKNLNDRKGDKQFEKKSENEAEKFEKPSNISIDHDRNEGLTAPYTSSTKTSEDNVVDDNTLNSSTDQSYGKLANNPKETNVQPQENVSKTSKEDDVGLTTSPAVKNNQPELNVQSREDISKINNVVDNNSTLNSPTIKNGQSHDNNTEEQNVQSQENVSKASKGDSVVDNNQSYGKSSKEQKNPNVQFQDKGKGKSKSTATEQDSIVNENINKEESIPSNTTNELKDSKNKALLDKEKQVKDTLNEPTGTTTDPMDKEKQVKDTLNEPTGTTTDPMDKEKQVKDTLNEPTGTTTDPIQAKLNQSHAGNEQDNPGSSGKKKKKKKNKQAEKTEKAENSSNSSTTQNQSPAQSSIYSGVIHKVKNFIMADDEFSDDECVKIIFHVHLPQGIHSAGEPVVIGNIEELGNWEDVKVKLYQHRYRYTYTSYWYSNPIRIPLERFQGVVNYKYAVHLKKQKNKNGPRFQFEGYNKSDDRVLESQCKNQFDIWKSNNDRYILNGRVNDYMFLDVIYNSVNSDNFKEAIFEYDATLKAHRELTVSATNFEFIGRRVPDEPLYKRLFLCFLLGHCRPNFGSSIELPNNFQHAPLLKVIDKIQLDTFPSNNLRVVLKGIELLIHRDIDRGSFEWLNIFPIAHHIDPQYKFIETISFGGNDKKYIERFVEMLPVRIIPFIEVEGESIYVKIFKWLISLCNNPKMSSIIWQLLIHSEETDKQLIPYLVERIGKVISNYDSVELHKSFTELPEHIGNLVTEPFRKKILQILTKNHPFDKSRSEAIYHLLNFARLRWTKDEYIIVLETVSNSTSFLLLKYFPQFLKNWIDRFKDIKDEKIHQICIQWYKHIMERMSNISCNTSSEGAYVTEVFERLSSICMIISEPAILDKLTEMTFNRIRQSSESLIFSATTKVANLNSKAILVFKKVAKEKLDKIVQAHDEFLLKKMRIICGCTGNNLEIPNELCEEILIHIMSCLQKSSPNIDLEEFSTRLHLSLFESADFWIVILRATGSNEKFHSHPLIQEARTAILKLVAMINDGSIDILLLQDLLVRDDNFIHHYLNSAKFNKLSKEIITKEKLAEVREQCHIYERKFKILDEFYKRFCPSQKVKDVQRYFDELSERSNSLDKISLEDALSPDHWGFLKETLSIAETTNIFNGSQTFYNIFEKQINDQEDIRVEFIAKVVMKDVLDEYRAICKQYEKWRNLEYSKATSFWYNVSNYDSELKLMQKYGNIIISGAFKRTIRYLSEVKYWIERLKYLSMVLIILKVPRLENDWLESAFSDLNDDLNLGTLSDLFATLDQKFDGFNNNSWALIKELSLSGDFIEFLRTIAEHDMKNLINGVDEHSDTRLIQEDTVSSLIQVKQFLLPLMTKTNLTLDKFLKELNGIVIKNPSLAGKLTLCNSNCMALQNMYKTISNRGEVTKEKIENAVSIGIYFFEKEDKDEECVLTLKYPSKSNITSYDINELQDLRGRALLISKPGGSLDGQIDNIKNIMEEFVLQVDIAQNIIIIMKKLTQLGHFGYRKYKDEAKGTKRLRQIADKLKNDLKHWERIVNQAQENCYYLTFYPARHILAFYDFYTKTGRQITISKTCQTLVSFVNRKANLSNRQKSQGFSCKRDDHYQILKEIGDRLESIFGKLPKHTRSIRDSGERIISDVVKCGELFVAACGDKLRVPNIIMSFYANHGSYPEPWQLLICTASTTAEELSIFIKRCFLASKNGYKNHLFCIANLELLDFELQYDLVIKIRSYMEKVKDYYLALICCSEIGMHHHILDQFSDNVHPTNGLSDGAMKVIYRELCKNVVCVTSDLSGQGKTEWIKQESYRKRLVPKSFLISDGASYNSLVRQLRDFHIRQVDSLHINIISADDPVEVNVFLFQLLTLGTISNNSDIASLPATHIFIEIASSVDQRLLNSLPFINCLDKPHLKWNISRLMVSQEIHSPIQIVCHYLYLFEQEELDKKDIFFQTESSTDDGDDIVKVPLQYKDCQRLLDKYFFKRIDANILSYRFLEIFINVLADQLIRLSSSSFFEVHNLNLMVRDKNVRTTLFNTLFDVSKDFATKSIKSKSAQLKAIADETEIAQLKNLVQWDDSNHLLVFFMSQTPDSICSLYRDKAKVPNNVQNLLKSQHIDAEKKWKLIDYHTMPSEQLLSTLECLARKTMHHINYPQYALSVDNLLKMALMLLRTRANIPVVVCGEAGCGKTSLIAFLAKVVKVEFKALNLHAGITEKNIKDFMKESDKKAQASEIWLFFDEINTCNHIGLLADLIAHRMLDGKPINPNIRLFAACNPYRIRKNSISNVGIKPKNIRFEEQSRLVYEVKPLPDQILDYVWDYGRLQPEDEKIYIQIMVKDQLENLGSPILAELLFVSQEFIRNVEESYSVSLRDVKRAIKLVKFFHGSLQNRPRNPKDNKKYYNNVFPSLAIRSYILALGLCYQSRLYDREIRKKYREEMCKIFLRERHNIREALFDEIIREEQMDYIKRMTCPPNTAFNEALLENVLVIIVCILNRMPLFIVGSPGSSKSLAIRLVHQNLRGSDSSDAYFRTLPQVFFIPHQGSSSSTSDGIEKVFQKAKAYQETSSEEFPVISVVLLDEVGLAETSPFNPLKVLHSLLEPSYPAEGPTVSVVGISNWRLDNSKSSRALLVQRPKFDLDDLVETAVRLLDKDSLELPPDKIKNYRASLRPLAEAYSDYEANGQVIFPNFHGLRDYYALVKNLSSNKEMTPENIHLALARNFGGIEDHTKKCLEYFKPVIKAFNEHKHWTYDSIPINILINENLESEGSRHLMVIGKSDSIVNILTYQLREMDLDPVVILGSQFPEDRDDYSYSILSRIMMCVEAGRPLILTDLEIIYGSLYDLWNQNYITMGSSDNPKYFTRVALGAYANPMLYVHPDFRCILVLDEKKLKEADPPLLNRFEKQRITLNDMLSKDQKELVKQLEEWTRQMSTIAGTNLLQSQNKFTQKDLFIGFNEEETLQSLIIDIKKKDPNMGEKEILEKCKETLIAIATSDGMVRIDKSPLEFNEIQHCKNIYFQVQHHNDIADYFQYLLYEQNVNQDGHLTIINTFSNINTAVKPCLKNVIAKCYVMKLSIFKSESQFQKQVKQFWLDSDNELLILHCDINTVNAECIKLAKFIIEQFRNEYLRREQENNAKKIKHACIILHIHRELNVNLTSFNFMCGWEQITIETLKQQERPLSVLLEGNLCDIIETIYPFEDILKQEILWCLLCMKYPNNVKSVNHVKYLSKKILDHPNFVKCLKMRTQEWLNINAKPDWQYNVASNKKLLYPYSSFSMALQAQIRTIVRHPIAKILCSLERLGATKTFLIHDLPESDMSQQREQFLIFWKELFSDDNIIDIDRLPEPKPDGYSMPVSVFDLHFPFSFYFMKQIDSFKTLYEEEMSMLSRDAENINPDTGKLLDFIYEDYISSFTKKIFNSIVLLRNSPLENASDLYFNDFVNIICNSETSIKNISVLSYIFKCKLGKEDILNPILLHISWWENPSSTLAEFQLVHMCPTIINHIYHDGDVNTNFEDYLVDEVASTMLKRICICKSQEIMELQREIRKVLNLCEKVSGFAKSESFQLLQICNDLLSTELIPLNTIREIIKIGESDDEMFSTKFIYTVFGNFRNIESIDQYNKILFAKQSFVMKCLEIIPFESPSKMDLYNILFLEEPFPLMGKIIKNIFEEENKNNPFNFFTWLNNPEEMLHLQRFVIINACLENKGCHSSMAALFCDIIQETYFAQCDLIHLSPYFRHAAEVLYSNSTEALQKITAIAFLKEFVHKFWNDTIQDNTLQPIELNFMEIGDFDFGQIIYQINQYMDLPYSLIHSLKIYFLRDLRNRGFSIDNVKKFCQAQKYTLPWLGTLSWDNSQEVRLQFNVYYSFEDYFTVERFFSLLYSYNNTESFNPFFKILKRKESIKARISFMGVIFNRLHAIRATREWTHVENQAAGFLNEKAEHISSLPNIYRQIIRNITTNQRFIMHLDANVRDSELLIKSVIGHVIALHSSIQADSSPLAYLLHNLNYCSGLYILTCPSDIESIILSAVFQKNGQFTRYKCKCGYVYLIGDCGQANGTGKCPECNNAIGGINHVSEAGNTKLDTAPIRKGLVAKDDKGYIIEAENEDINHNVRNLPPVSYRVLHLFVHSIIGAWAPSGTATSFLQKNNNSIHDSLDYCMRHIRNDWRILLRLLDCSEENLALLLHAILDRMISKPPNDTTLKTPQEREEWETKFAQNYVSPLIRNVTNTATEFRVKLDTALAKTQGNSNIIEGEINQTLPMDNKYIRESLPRLWRSIGTISFQGFRAYYNSDTEKHESRFPFISVFFRYFDKLDKVKYLWPIVNFVQIISSRLGYRVNREKAQEKTFKEFIDEESNNGEYEEVFKFLSSNFNDFANAWNKVIVDVDQFQCHELPKPKPNINLNYPIALALVEPKDSGVYLCAILDYLIGLQNNFLQEVLTIPTGSSKALKFLEEPYFVPGRTPSVTSTEGSSRYYLQSLRIDQTKQINFINYKWDDEILQNSDRNLETGRGQDIIYDLQKIEMDLARKLVFEKVHIDTLNDSQAYIEPFAYHMELFQGHMRILGDIKSLILQQHIPSDKIPLIMGATSTSYRHHHNIYSLSYDTASELLSSLEILLCFVKRTSVGNGETKIADYVNQWMKLSVLLENKFFNNLLNIPGLYLKHLIALYELIEIQVANSVINYVDEKFKIQLTDEVKGNIDSIVDFERTSAMIDQELIPAETFAIALKRFMLRFLKVDSNKDRQPLKYYIMDEGLNLWPTNISEELLEKIFPESILVCHIYEAYKYVNSKIEEIMKKHQQTGGNRNTFNGSLSDNWMNNKSDESEYNTNDVTTVPMSSEFATGSNFSNSFAGPSRPRQEQSSSQQQRRRPRKRGGNNRFDAM